MGDILNTLHDISETAGQFLIIDLQTALTFVQIARTSDVAETRARNRRNALRAYTSVCEYLVKGHFSENDLQEIELLLAELKRSLDDLGERV